MQCVKALVGLLAVALVCGGCGLTAPIAAKSAIPAADFYVATNGNDTWSGKLPAPNSDPDPSDIHTGTSSRPLLN